MSTAPKWFRPVAVVALLWNLMGCAAFVADLMLTAEDMAAMTPAQQALYEALPAWGPVGTALAVWGGALGCIALLLGRRWAVPVLGVSLAGVIIQDVAIFGFAGGATAGGFAAIVLQGLVLAVAVGLLVLARHAAAEGWLR